ncbi:MAG: radical SAM family heme chaperone HemW, partial [Nitrospirales bacterium]|nr:radical SAM family heme chaperone HemW [Nitrospirales bacterium]
LKNEIRLWGLHEGFQFRKISSVYFGGGTPTVLTSRQFSDILTDLRNQWSFDSKVEITVESTPELLNREKADALKMAGVTRVSLGVQSFDPRERETLGLAPETQQIDEAVFNAKQSGFNNINLDVIYGIPGQTLFSWEDLLRRALDFEPAHLSCYALSLEEGTHLYRQWKGGKFSPADPDEEFNYQQVAEDQLNRKGFVRYEISNWARPGFACQHNLRYWQGLDYLGLGPSAQSYVLGNRWGNISDLFAYSRQLARECLPIQERETLSWIQQQRERVIFGLRKMNGVPCEWVDRLQEDVDWTRRVHQLVACNLLSRADARYVLTPKGRRFSDRVCLELL